MNATMRAAQGAWQNLLGFIAATHLSLKTAGIQLCLVQRRLVPAGMMHQGQGDRNDGRTNAWETRVVAFDNRQSQQAMCSLAVKWVQQSTNHHPAP